MLDTASEHSSLDTLSLGGRLSQLSRAKGAVALNSVHHVRMNTTYELEKHVTVYVLDVYLQATPRGLPKTTTIKGRRTTYRQSRRPRRRVEGHEKEEEEEEEEGNGRADYHVEHRYSAFRELREHVGEAVAAPKDKSHPYWCPYCSRVREVLRSVSFPSRCPTRGRLALVTGFLYKTLVRSREQRLGVFIDQLLHAARDMSYRSGCDPCGRFEAVSGLLSDFITPMTMMTKERMSQDKSPDPVACRSCFLRRPPHPRFESEEVKTGMQESPATTVSGPRCSRFR
uniref:PX domain-containing protein n=1 Tax=Peronospora matthiolae TaxID=2874970 RepID=A0AAV1TAH1_9STRA